MNFPVRTSPGNADFQALTSERHHLAKNFLRTQLSSLESLRTHADAFSMAPLNHPDESVAEPPRLRALIADDNEDFCLLIQQILSDLNIETYSSANGKDALRAIQETNPDFVLCDIFMPDKDGIEVLREVSALPHPPTIIATSGCVRGESSWVERVTLDLGAARFLQKPFSPDELERTIRELFPEQFAGPQQTVLLVEDDSGLCQLLQSILEDAGYRVTIANDGLDAMVSSRLGTPDIVVTDLMMPTADGMAVLRDIHEVFPGVPVVIMSGAFTIDQNRGIEALKAGATSLLSKPFTPEDILDAVKQALPKPSHLRV